MAEKTMSRSNASYSAVDVNQMTPGEAALTYFRQYAQERPEVVALWALGIGFLLGWKLKPW